MHILNQKGHLHQEVLAGLLDESLPERERLAAAQHLAECDECLDEYTRLLCSSPLLSPAQPLGPPVHREIARREAARRQNRLRRTAMAACCAAAIWAVCLLVLPPSTDTPAQNRPPAAWHKPTPQKAHGEDALGRAYSFFSGLCPAGRDAEDKGQNTTGKQNTNKQTPEED